MSSFRPIRSLTMRTWIVVRLACPLPNAVAERMVSHRCGVVAAQILCIRRSWRALSRRRSAGAHV